MVYGRRGGWGENDTTTESKNRIAFIKKNKELKTAVIRTEDFVRMQLGDARSFIMDSPKGRAQRIEALRKSAAG